ncbi:pyruvate dehydrogenase E2 component (dihydrolipoamide acetyltransferase) [Streptomyces sp. 1114.5]|uniref:dihydrolipoamide acetyltransferase family protein n=1 Tax=Streptomyces sp. 1114.5 TaxID=1938830 RepID=UPI000EB5633A|nr:dihydrolipoamide acetyltransferase family protein [Streptomyces sp. 1114.5]RKT16803.1 pyruvate dehydrogenase E2 component (dihydrolipoamide acetyltransferase) [Streptomyces sp. 1114.5]
MTTEVRSLREFKMPDVGEGLTEAEILSWYVKPGDTVTDGQVVCEVETAKAAVELPIPFNGVVEQLFFPEGATVDVGTVIISVAVAGEAGAAAPAASAAAPAPVAAAAAAVAVAEEEVVPERREVLVGYGPRTGGTQRRARRTTTTKVAATAPAPAAPAPVAPAVPAAPVAPVAEVPSGERPLAKPPVRKLAKDLGVDLRAVTPTGRDGVITREDVHAYAAAQAAPVAPAAAAPAAQAVAVEAVAGEAVVAPVPVPTAGDVRVPVKGVRKATAQAMVASAFTAPHVTEFVQVDVTRTMKFVRRLKESGELGRDVRVSPLLIVAKALLTAIKRHPEINAQWDEAAQEIVIKGQVNLGIAAATPRGLIVPNIKDAGSKTLAGLATSLGELVETARQGKTSPADMQGGTVTITNVGVFGVDTGTPILNPGEAAILAFGAVRELPWVHKGKVVPRQVTTLALSFDHRLVDGELGSKVLADVAALLEQPKRLITWG